MKAKCECHLIFYWNDPDEGLESGFLKVDRVEYEKASDEDPVLGVNLGGIGIVVPKNELLEPTDEQLRWVSENYGVDLKAQAQRDENADDTTKFATELQKALTKLADKFGMEVEQRVITDPLGDPSALLAKIKSYEEE